MIKTNQSHFGRSMGAMIILLCLVVVAGCGAPAPQVTVTPPVGPNVVVTQPQPTPPPPPRLVNQVVTEEWVHLPAFILYPVGSSRLDDESRAMLREAHASMAYRTDIIRVRVEGHADSQGNAAVNQRIAQERAQNVVDFLVGDLGMPRELFEVQGFGDDVMRTSGSTASDRMLNRRVEFSILVRRTSAQ